MIFKYIKLFTAVSLSVFGLSANALMGDAMLSEGQASPVKIEVISENNTPMLQVSYMGYENCPVHFTPYIPGLYNPFTLSGVPFAKSNKGKILPITENSIALTLVQENDCFAGDKLDAFKSSEDKSEASQFGEIIISFSVVDIASAEGNPLSKDIVLNNFYKGHFKFSVIVRNKNSKNLKEEFIEKAVIDKTVMSQPGTILYQTK